MAMNETESARLHECELAIARLNAVALVPVKLSETLSQIDTSEPAAVVIETDQLGADPAVV